MSNKTFYRRNLPHIQPEGSTFFITTRLYGSIPKVKLDELKQQYSKILMGNNNIKDKRERNIQNYELRKQYFFSLEELLHKINSGPNYLSNLEIAEIVKNQIVRFHGEFL